jgi:A/G-specific adenine glycosylase
MQSAVLDWYAANARDLAFRRTSDPWSVLVSEVIAQQTQASRAAEAWTRFIDQFPTPAALAAASPATAIRAWRGLGYNRRAIALRAAAIAIVEEHGGEVPRTFDALIRLPGVGPYTARAVLAIAFDQPVAALDTNIRRVVGRAFLGGEGALARRELQSRADTYVPPEHAAAWTHALMDVGAAFCRKRDPRCEACPLAGHCRYLVAGRPASPGGWRAPRA